MHRRYIWLHEPCNQNHRLDTFLSRAAGFDYLVANGDYSCNSGFVGVSDDAACQSARECLAKLREKFGPKFQATYGDHDLGKLSFVANQGGMRLASWRRAQEDLGLPPFWRMDIGKYVLFGIVSSLVALPIFEPDTLPFERAEWERLREEHLSQIRQ